ncbi:MAG TPA: flavin monoamine oxidase family protein, partial [Mycobacterium sp.]|nr:flavin monoamine oxidase family protein [Mycobacterium sp.]
MVQPRSRVDAVVVGAGFAGLTAARDLCRLGHDVRVLEGRDRVGGRSFTGHVAGIPIDLGATFVGPTQDAVLALAGELGISTKPIYHHGANRIRWRGRLHSYSGTIPRLSLGGLLDIGRVRWQFSRIARSVPVAEPWTAPQAPRLDRQSLGGWLRSVHAGGTARDLLAVMARVVWGCEPDDVSMLQAARYVRAAGGIDRLLDVQNGAQQDYFPGGSQQIADTVAAELGDRIVLGAVVDRIAQHDRGVTISDGKGTVEARFVFVAIPPEHRAGIAFTPPLPAEYDQLANRWPQGRLSKAYAAYATPFWRTDGFSGQALSDEGPVFLTFDASPPDDRAGILLGFVDARGFDHLPADQRRQRALACFASLFGDAALKPLDYVDQRWGAEQFAPGGPTAAVPPGSWMRYGP